MNDTQYTCLRPKLKTSLKVSSSHLARQELVTIIAINNCKFTFSAKSQMKITQNPTLSHLH